MSSLRDEMLDLGPYAYDEISFEEAVARCLGAWERRYGIRTQLDTEPLDLPSEMEGELFRITQEAVSNAGRHGESENVRIKLTSHDGMIELSVADDGKGFGGVDPLGRPRPGTSGWPAFASAPSCCAEASTSAPMRAARRYG